MGDINKRNYIFEKINEIKNEVDIIFLQETHINELIYQKISDDWKIPNVHFWSEENTSKGVATLFLNKNIKLIEKIELNERCIKLKILLNNIEILIINSYIPSTAKERNEYLNEFSIDSQFNNIIWGGDFNFVEEKEDCSSGNSMKGKLKFKEIIDKNGFELTDCYSLSENKKLKTFKHVNGNYEARLDRFYISKPLYLYFETIERKSAWFYYENENKRKNLSDHWPIMLTLKFKDIIIGKGYWKLNTSILDLNSSKIKITAMIEKSEKENDSIKRLEFILNESKSILKNTSKIKNKILNDLLKDIDNKIQNITERNGNLSEIEILEEKRSILERPQEIFKMKLLKMEKDLFDEIPSKLLSNKLKAKSIDGTIESLKKDSGEIVEDMDNILEECVNFYEKLYNLEDSTKKNRKKLLKNIKRKLKAKDNENLIRPFNDAEIHNYIKKTKTDSSPGEDGLPYEFYQKFNDILTPHLTDAFNTILTNPKLLPKEWKNGIIKLLFKKGDRKLLTNWRPITLLRTIFKIFTGLISERISVVIPKIIHENQKGFVKKRFILDNVLTLRTIRESCDEGFIALLDFEKAFDRVNHNLIIDTFKKIGFCNKFILIIIAIIGGDSKIYINDFFSRSFSLKNGVRQGDTISPVLFIIVIESLAENIRNDKNCIGLEIGGVMIKLLLFADDISLFPLNEESLSNMNRHVETLNLANNGKINRNKCSIIPLNENFEQMELQEIPIIKEGQSERYLGYEILKNKSSNGISNAISRFEILLKKWKLMHLSIYGAANVLRSYAIPIISYQTFVDTPTSEQIKKVENLSKWFLYYNENNFDTNKQYKAKLNDSRAFVEQKEGGLGITPFNVLVKAQRIFWIKRVMNNESTDGWVYALKQLLLKGFNKFAPVELLNKVPKWLQNENKLKSIKNILTVWFSLKKFIPVEKNKTVGIINSSGILQKICRVLPNEKTLIIYRNQKGKLLPTQKLINIDKQILIPIRTKYINGFLYFKGIYNKNKIFSSSLFEDGNKIKSATLREISKNILPVAKLSPKQQDWAGKYKNFQNNYKILHTSKVRMKIKSHIFKRLTNILPRNREEDCPFCPNNRETSDHILTECAFLREKINFIKKILKKEFQIETEEIDLMTIISNDEIVRPIQLFTLYLVWNLRCKIKFENYLPKDIWNKLMQKEFERFIFKENMKKDKESFLENWNSIISFVDGSLIVKSLFHTPLS